MYRYVLANNTTGAAYTTGDWRTYPVNTEEYDDIGIGLASSIWTFPEGEYTVETHSCDNGTGGNRQKNARFINVNTSAVVAYGMSGFYVNGTQYDEISVLGCFLVTAAMVSGGNNTFRLEWKTSVNSNFGRPFNGGVDEVYAEILFTKAA
jgi:hypothetical protein